MTAIIRFEYLCILLGVLTTFDAAAQGYPLKPARFVAPYPAGRVHDIVPRMLRQRLSSAMGQQWLIEEAGIPRE